MLEFLKFDEVKNLVRINRIEIDSMVFRLHYIYTVVILLLFCAILSATQYVGEPILCMERKNIDKHVMDTYCWIHGTFTVKKPNMSEEGSIFPGINSKYENQKHYYQHTYYQWVCFFLFFQSVLFYVPRRIWKHCEGGLIQALSLKSDNIMYEETQKQQNIAAVVKFLHESMGCHSCYALRYFVSELLCLINAISQMYLVNVFLNGEFLKYGIEVIKYNMNDDDNLINPMLETFPRMSKCFFYYYGSSGNIIKIDNLCMLPLNVINEKIFIFLWFWFIILILLSAISVIYRIILIISGKMRLYILSIRYRLVRETYLELLIKRLSVGDWFIVYMLGKNIDRFILTDILCEFWKRVNGMAENA
ncbi:innexin shaking-B-like [Centruroides sculpturatus]|uniref:innexin shaking-B-like n=1 Tax=Centruroides sculpturatus TaxID=218467 RepID=UPI000C6ED907|nr:innexin shaking-B-like [Centruroides sculpturatus]